MLPAVYNHKLLAGMCSARSKRRVSRARFPSTLQGCCCSSTPTSFPSLSLNPAECLKKLGNDAFVAKNYTLALAYYNAAVELCATKHVRTLAPAA